MFNLNTKKYGIANLSIKGAIISLLFIVYILLTSGCVHPICEEINSIDSISKKILHKMVLKPGSEGKDAIVVSYFNEMNYGNYKTLSCTQMGEYPFQYIEEGYIDFALAEAIPPGAKVIKATLTLFADTVNSIAGGLRPIGHYYTSGKQWKISIISSFWDELKINWDNRPQIDKEFAILNGPDLASQPLVIDVTEYAVKKVNRMPGVYGLSFYFDYGPSVVVDGAIRFCSSDHQEKDLWPELYIEYEK